MTFQDYTFNSESTFKFANIVLHGDNVNINISMVRGHSSKKI